MDTLTVPASSNQAESAYATVGRALSLASSFEAECRLVAFALGLKKPSPIADDMEAFTRFLESVATAKLIKNHEAIASGLNLPGQYIELLSTARNARNYVAHEAGEEIETKFRDQEKWSAWCQALRESVLQIAVGKQIVAILLARVAKCSAPTASVLSAYPEYIVQWVFSEHAPRANPAVHTDAAR